MKPVYHTTRFATQRIRFLVVLMSVVISPIPLTLLPPQYPVFAAVRQNLRCFCHSPHLLQGVLLFGFGEV